MVSKGQSQGTKANQCPYMEDYGTGWLNGILK